MADAFIVDAVRTAGGRRNGALKDWHPADLGAAVLDALIERTGVDPAAMTMSWVPLITAWAAKCTDCCELPHWRSIETAGTLSGSLEAITMLRPMWKACSPIWPTQPTITSSIAAPSTPVRSIKALRTAAPRSAGCQSFSAPSRLPPAVRTASTI